MKEEGAPHAGGTTFERQCKSAACGKPPAVQRGPRASIEDVRWLSASVARTFAHCNHEHKTWAVIGISEGCEVDELFEERHGRLARTTRHELRQDDVLVLPPDCIHFIADPMPSAARGIHVYGRNVAMTDRRMWHPETATPQAMDFAVFEEWERMLTRRSKVNGLIAAPALAPG
jgi:hypothetical protein